MARSRLCRHHVCHGAAGEPRLLPTALTRRRPSAPPASWKRNRRPDLDPTLSVVVAKHRQQRGSSKPAGRPQVRPRPPAASGTTPPHRRRGATAAGCGTPRQSHPCALQSQPRRPTAAGRRRPRPPRQVPHGVPPVSSAESNLNSMRSGRLTSNGPSGPPHLVGHMARRLVAVVEPEELREPRDPLNLGAVTPNCIRTPPRRGRRRALPSNACCTMRLQCCASVASLCGLQIWVAFSEPNCPIAAITSNFGCLTLHGLPLESGARLLTATCTLM